MGKNDFSTWWENFKEYECFEKFEFDRDYKIASIFIKEEAVLNSIVKAVGFSALGKEPVSLYFEKLPFAYDEELYQYKYADFVYSKNAKFQKEMRIQIGEFYVIDDNNIVQLF